jgi:hypothetical protein
VDTNHSAVGCQVADVVMSNSKQGLAIEIIEIYLVADDIFSHEAP